MPCGALKVATLPSPTVLPDAVVLPATVVTTPKGETSLIKLIL